MPPGLGHHNARTQSGLAAGPQGTLLSLRQDLRANSRRTGLGASMPTRKAKSPSRPAKKAASSKKPAKSAKAKKPAARKAPSAPKSPRAKSVKLRPLDVSAFPPESLSIVEKRICLA